MPDGAAQDRLRDAAARRWRLPPGGAICLGSGSQAAIQGLPRIIPATSVAVVGPTYGEHARAWAAAGHLVTEISDPCRAGDASVVVVVNPNNPDGRVIAPATLLDVAGGLAARGGLLVVDEAFGDERPELSLVPFIRPGLAVLRSFGKFFGLAGVRLGFAACPAALAARLEAHLGPWAVSGPALEIGAAALADEGWTWAAMDRLAAASARLDAILAGGGLEVPGGTGLFRLARHRRAGELYDHLGRRGILVRAFTHRADILRFGLPGNEDGEARLRGALADWPGRS